METVIHPNRRTVMLKKDIKVGGHYRAKVSNKLVPVRVLDIYKNSGGDRYQVWNLVTGRKTTFKSAAKFQSEITLAQAKAIVKHGEKAHCVGEDIGQIRKRVDKAEGIEEVEQSSDPTATTTGPNGDGTGAAAIATKEAAKATVNPTAPIKPIAASAKLGEGKQSPPFRALASNRLSSPASAVVKPAVPNGKLAGSQFSGLKLKPAASVATSAATVPVRTSAPIKPASNGSTPMARLLKNAIAAVKPQPILRPDKALIAKLGRVPTQEQFDIIQLASKLGKGDVLVIEAGAGTGKTTTDTMLEQVLPGRGQYTAFNSSLVKESKTKFKICECNTTHSLAFRAEGKWFAHRLEGHRMKSEAVAAMLGIKPITVKVKMGEDDTGKPIIVMRSLAPGYLSGLVMGAIRLFCQSADRKIGEGHFKYIDGIDMPEDGQRTYVNNKAVQKYLAPFATKAWADLSTEKGTLPFFHDVYVKIWQLGKPYIYADYILLDEAQDTAPVTLDIIKQQRHALTILVGDSAQQIYEWRGAVNAMAPEEWPEAPRLMLSQSFRFGPAIAGVANQILEKVGTPLRLQGLASIPSRVEACSNPTAILCRTNAAAVGKVLLAISEGKRPFLVGGGAEVISFVKGARDLQANRPSSHPDLACFDTWGEVQAYAKLDEGEDLKLWVKLIDNFGCERILSALEGMPTEKDADIVICTAHKSKGREWDRVKLATDFPTLSKCSEADLKLLYVAATRAKLILDVTECPFFSGEDGVEIIPPAPEVGSVLPPTPAIKPQVNDFSWANYNQDWCIRGPKGHEGDLVQVTRRNGATSNVRLGNIIKEFEDACIYQRG